MLTTPLAIVSVMGLNVLDGMLLEAKLIYASGLSTIWKNMQMFILFTFAELSAKQYFYHTQQYFRHDRC